MGAGLGGSLALVAAELSAASTSGGKLESTPASALGLSAIRRLSVSDRGSAAAGPVVLDPASRLWIEGTSTLHDWSSKANKLELTIAPEVEGSLEELVRSGGVTAGKLSVPVADMKSHKDGLDKNMRKALLAEKYPAIEFVLEKYTATQPEGADSMMVKADGKLSIAGVTKPIQIEAGARHEGNGLRLRGREPVLMADYGIKPPVMMMGTVKAGKEVMVYFDLLLVPGPTRSAEAKP